MEPWMRVAIEWSGICVISFALIRALDVAALKVKMTIIENALVRLLDEPLEDEEDDVADQDGGG